MLLTTPADIGDPLYEGGLWFEAEEVNRVLPSRGPGDVPSPHIGIGQPQWWDLAALTHERGEELPSELRLLLDEADFFLVRLACSFRPTHASWIESARFTAYLRPKGGGETPIAFDLHPRDVHDEVARDLKVSISPSLKFKEVVEASLGAVELGIQYKKLEPVVVGTGALQSNPAWDFARTKQQDVRGAKFLHLIVKRAKGSQAVRTTFELQAQVRIRQGLLRGAIKEEANSHLGAVICG
jgi:hypothetical protein